MEKIKNLNNKIDISLNDEVSLLYSQLSSILQMDKKLYWELEEKFDRRIRGQLYGELYRQLNWQLVNRFENGEYNR